MIFNSLISIYLHKIIRKVKKTSKEDFISYVHNHGIKKYPKIKNIDETIEELIKTNKSIARFGDGEFSLCMYNSISFQKRSLSLKRRLEEILKNENPNCLVAISDYNISEFNAYWYQFWYENTEQVVNLLNSKSTYFHSGITRSSNIDHFEKLKSLWFNRNVIFVYGKDSRFDVKHEVFEGINSYITIEGKAVNAWDDYSELYLKTLKSSKNIENPLVLCALGPTATVLAYDLSLKNIQSVDLGHLVNVFNQLKYGAKKPEDL